MNKLILELTKKEINYFVAKAESRNFEDDNTFTKWVENGCIIDGFYFDPCNNIAQAWPIIEREKPTLSYHKNQREPFYCSRDGDDWQTGSTYLIAFFRWYLINKYGESVEIQE